jgi:hypothetical protein
MARTIVIYIILHENVDLYASWRTRFLELLVVTIEYRSLVNLESIWFHRSVVRLLRLSPT